MGILSKIFGKKSLESLKQFEEEIIKFQKKYQCEIVALIGTGGRLKGLPLVYSANDETALKKYTARITELVNPINIVTEGKNYEKMLLYFEENVLTMKRITPDVSFFILAPKKTNELEIQKWMINKSPDLENLFLEKD